MFKTLRRQLTLICAAGASVVLVLMATVALSFSLRQLEQQTAEKFNSSVSSMALYIQFNRNIDQSWISHTEQDGRLWMDIFAGDSSMLYTKLNLEKTKVIQQAMQFARQNPQFQMALESIKKQEGIPFTLEFEIPVDSVEYRCAVVVLHKNNSDILLTVVQDKSEQKQAGAQLGLIFAACVVVGGLLLWLFAWQFSKIAVKPVEQSQKLQREFISAASHELRTPLAVVWMNAESIGSFPENAAIYAEKIEQECQRMSTLVNDLLMLADTGVKERDPQREKVSCLTLLICCFERFEGLAEKRGIQFSMRADDFPESVLCDRQRIEQLLAVLVDNAFSYAKPQGNVRISGGSYKNGVVYSVEDDGPGVPKNQRDKIFQSFYQADAARSNTQHYGLGLSVAAKIAAAHKGNITVSRSTLGGAKFTLWLPLR